MLWNYQNAGCSLRKKFYRVIYWNFRHTFVPYSVAREKSRSWAVVVVSGRWSMRAVECLYDERSASMMRCGAMLLMPPPPLLLLLRLSRPRRQMKSTMICFAAASHSAPRLIKYAPPAGLPTVRPLSSHPHALAPDSQSDHCRTIAPPDLGFRTERTRASDTKFPGQRRNG